MDDLADQESEPRFTAQTSARLVAAGQALAEAFQSYVASAALVTTEAGVDALEQSEWAVAIAAALFDDAHFDHLGVWAPLGDAELLEDEDSLADDDDDEEEDLDEAIAAGGAVSVVSRQDFVVTDPAAVLSAARDAWSRCHDEDAENVEIPTAGHALYELIHDGGRDSLNDLAGLTPLASIIVFRQPAAPLDGARMDQADSELENGFPSLFEPDGVALFSFSEQWR